MEWGFLSIDSGVPAWINTEKLLLRSDYFLLFQTLYNAVEFKVVHETKFSSIIFAHDIYKAMWNAVIGQV